MQINMIYMVTLYDYNRSPIADGTTSFFTEDIDDFQSRWFALEKDSNRKDRFLRSKGGEIVADWYSNEEELNIVQRDVLQIYDEKEFILNKKRFEVTNAYCCPYSFYAEKIRILIRWIKFKDKYYRIAHYKADGICETDSLGQNVEVKCRGNRILECNTPFKTKYGTSLENTKYEDFADNSVESICYVLSGYFEDKTELEKDIDGFEISDEILDRICADIVGET